MSCNEGVHAGYLVTDVASNSTYCMCAYYWWADPVSCSIHVTQQSPQDWLTFQIITTGLTGIYSLLLIWSTIYCFVSHLPPFEKACHLLMSLWSVCRSIWPWMPVTTDGGHLFYKWIDNLGGDLFLTYLFVVSMMLIALALQKNIVVFKGIRGWYKGALITLLVLLFIIEIASTYLIHFLYLEIIMMVYLIYYLFALGSIAIFSFITGGIIIHTLRMHARKLENKRAGSKTTKIAIHMFIISVCSLAAIPMLGYVLSPDASGYYPDMLIGGYLTYMVYIRVWEFVAALSFIARRGWKKFLIPFSTWPSHWRGMERTSTLASKNSVGLKSQKGTDV